MAMQTFPRVWWCHCKFGVWAEGIAVILSLHTKCFAWALLALWVLMARGPSCMSILCLLSIHMCQCTNIPNVDSARLVHYLCFLPLESYPHCHLMWTSLISTACPNYQEDTEPTRHSTLLLHCISMHYPQYVGHSRNCHNTATKYGQCIVYIYSLPLLLTPSTWLCETLHTNWRAYIPCLVLQRTRQVHQSTSTYLIGQVLDPWISSSLLIYEFYCLHKMLAVHCMMIQVQHSDAS